MNRRSFLKTSLGAIGTALAGTLHWRQREAPGLKISPELIEDAKFGNPPFEKWTSRVAGWWKPRTDTYLCLHTHDGAEVARGTGYVRMPISFGEVVDGMAVQDEDVWFPQATSNWGDVAFWSVVRPDGSLLGHGKFYHTRSIRNGDSVCIPEGEIALIA